jgi:hypothetical protein
MQWDGDDEVIAFPEEGLTSPFEQGFYTIGNASYCDFNIPGTFSMF